MTLNVARIDLTRFAELRPHCQMMNDQGSQMSVGSFKGFWGNYYQGMERAFYKQIHIYKKKLPYLRYLENSGH